MTQKRFNLYWWAYFLTKFSNNNETLMNVKELYDWPRKILPYFGLTQTFLKGWKFERFGALSGAFNCLNCSHSQRYGL